MAFMLKAADFILGEGEKLVEEIPFVGKPLGQYLGFVKNYIDENAADELKYPNGRPAPPPYNRNVVKPTAERPKIQTFAKPVLPPHRSELAPKHAIDTIPTHMSPSPTQVFTQRDYDIMESNLPRNIYPKVGVDFSTDPYANYIFPSIQNGNPNSAFGTTGFTNRNPTRGQAYTDKIYNIII